MLFIDSLAAALGAGSVTHVLFSVGLRDWLVDGDDVAGFSVVDSRPGRVTVELDGGPRRLCLEPAALARAVLDA